MLSNSTVDGLVRWRNKLNIHILSRRETQRGIGSLCDTSRGVFPSTACMQVKRKAEKIGDSSRPTTRDLADLVGAAKMLPRTNV